MDVERNEKLFEIFKEKCNWKYEMPQTRLNPPPLVCSACNLVCIMKNCTPFKFCIEFNRPELKRN